MARTSIEWTEETWNPIRGCSRVSPGCDNCYAMGQAHRFSGEGKPFEGLTTIRRGKVDWSGRVRLVPEMLDVPLRRRKRTPWFVNSMSDLFHESLTDGEIFAVFRVMAMAPQHTFQVLTKRPKRMREWVEKWNDLSGEPEEPALVRGPEETRRAHPSGRGQIFASYLETLGEPPPGCAFPTFDWMSGPANWGVFDWCWRNVWMGVSAEDQQRADDRIPHLLATPAAVRFVSAEPLLGPIEFDEYLSGEYAPHDWGGAMAEEDGPRIDWVIAGGESGPGARPCALEWLESIVKQCREAGTACFIKQLGACVVSEQRTAPADVMELLKSWERTKRDPYAVAPNGEYWAWSAGLRDKKGGDPAEWPADLRVREMPSTAADSAFRRQDPAEGRA